MWEAQQRNKTAISEGSSFSNGGNLFYLMMEGKEANGEE